MSETGVSIIIPTRNGGALFAECLECIGRQIHNGPVQTIVVDSGSTDGTPEASEKAGALVKRIRPKEFHHARTRNEAVPLAIYDRVVFMVQDAIPCSSDWLSSLAKGLDETGAAAVYTSQVPHDHASLYARFETESIRRARGEKAILQRLESLEAFHAMPYEEAYRRIALDNVCAMYRKELLLGAPFPEVDFGEDMAWSFRMLLSGQTIGYDPRIQVRHSHDRSPEYAFGRQIVNAIWCARIMNRVREDTSFLSPTDLVTLLKAARALVMELRADGKTAPGERPDPLTRLIRMAPIPCRLAVPFVHVARKIRQTPPFGLMEIRQQMEREIRSLYDVIRDRYPGATSEALSDALDRIAANVVGRAFGEAYASCLLKGGVPRALGTLIRAYATSV
jgi:glycosyltransferase involved in cell wall biosynthesis